MGSDRSSRAAPFDLIRLHTEMGLLREDIGGSARATEQAAAAVWALDQSVEALRHAISSIEAELTAVAGEVSVIRREMQRLDEIQRSIANLEASEVDQQIGSSLPPRSPNWAPPGLQDQRR